MAKDIPPNIEHETPPMFYCWKYWFQTGELKEGCTDVKSSPPNFLDLNEYGWVYIVIPVLGLFLLVFVFYCLCRGKSREVKRQPLMSEESDSDSEEAFRTRVQSGGGKYRAVPVRSADPRSFYTVVNVDPNDPRKIPLHGGVDPNSYIPQQRLYPRLTTMRQQAGLNGKTKSSASSKPKSVEAHVTNEYEPAPHGGKGAKKGAPDKEAVIEDHDGSSSEGSGEEI